MANVFIENQIMIDIADAIRQVRGETITMLPSEMPDYIKNNSQEYYGLRADFENKTFTRLGAAVGKTAGSDFDTFSVYGNRKRCNVADDGTVNAYYGDASYTEDGSNGQVMVEQPKFYYKVKPVKKDAQSDGLGYHLRCAEYYISAEKKPGYKIHPAFINENGDEIDKYYIGAYEACLYDDSESAYNTNDSQNMAVANDLLSSIANVKPASGLTQDLTRVKCETMAKNRGNGWHNLSVKIASAEQLLFIIEYGNFNTQSSIGAGVTGITDNSSYNCSSLTGSTTSLGNASGRATTTTNEINGTTTDYTDANKTAVSYRGVENFWGNIWSFINGLSIWGDGTMKGGQPYICTDFNYAENKKNNNYEAAGFTITNVNGYVSAFGYGNEDYDWLFIASETEGNSSLPVGDYQYIIANLNGYRIALLGGVWRSGVDAGGFAWALGSGVGRRNRTIGARLVYLPVSAA